MLEFESDETWMALLLALVLDGALEPGWGMLLAVPAYRWVWSTFVQHPQHAR